MKVFQGQLSASGLRFGIVVSRFNEFFTGKLLAGALDCLERHGADGEKIETAWVPGAWEIAPVAHRMAKSGRYDAVICLGAVIRGETPHWEYISNQLTRGISAAAIESGIPVVFGVITPETLEQAIERSGSKAGNKGFEAAMAAMETADLYRRLDGAGE